MRILLIVLAVVVALAAAGFSMPQVADLAPGFAAALHTAEVTAAHLDREVLAHHVPRNTEEVRHH